MGTDGTSGHGICPHRLVARYRFLPPAGHGGSRAGFRGLGVAKLDHWGWAGVLLGLAITSQQFALLVFAPLFMMASSRQRIRFGGAAVAVVALIDLPFIVASSGSAFRAVVIGSGNTASWGGTVLWELHPHGALLVATSRVLPILLSAALARWAVRRLGVAVFDPVPLVSIIATSLCLRLVFEQNLFAYYFMALAASLVVLDVARGRFRGYLVVWLVLVTMAYNPAPWGLASHEAGVWNWMLWHPYLPIVSMAALVIAFGVYSRRFRWYWIAASAVVAAITANIPLGTFMSRHPIPTWFWQLGLVSFGFVLAIGPLVSSTPPQQDPLLQTSRDPGARSSIHTGVRGCE